MVKLHKKKEKKIRAPSLIKEVSFQQDSTTLTFTSIAFIITGVTLQQVMWLTTPVPHAADTVEAGSFSTLDYGCSWSTWARLRMLNKTRHSEQIQVQWYRATALMPSINRQLTLCWQLLIYKSNQTGYKIQILKKLKNGTKRNLAEGSIQMKNGPRSRTAGVMSHTTFTKPAVPCAHWMFWLLESKRAAPHGGLISHQGPLAFIFPEEKKNTDLHTSSQ